jgi:FdhD protein
MTGSSREFDVTRTDGSQRSVVSDYVAVEEPLEIQICSADRQGAAAKSVSITMRTPGNDEELALGFLVTEGIIRTGADVVSVSATGEPDPRTGLRNIIRVEMAPGTDLKLDSLERHFYTTSSCGVCGKATLDALYVNGRTSLSGEQTTFPSAILLQLPAAVRRRQRVFDETGGLHAAAVFDFDGKIEIVREDVGRHNATDKAVGALLNAGRLPGHEFGLFVSGRASFELMQKALVAGIPLLAAVGAPSSLAIDTAAEFGMTLVGFLRDGTFNIYTGKQRVT